MLKKLKIPLIIAFTILSLSAIAYITAFSQNDLKEIVLLNTLIVLILLFSFLVIYRNSKEINMAQAKVNYWKEKAMLEDEAKRSKNYLETILNSSSDVICLVKRDGTFGYINPQVKNILGYPPEELRGKNILDLVPEDQKDFVMKKWKEMNSNYMSGFYETRFMKADESRIGCLVSHSYVQKYDEFLVSLKDISEQKKLQEKVTSIHALNRKLITVQNEEEIARAALETARKILNFEFCEFLLFDEEKDELVIIDNLGNSPNLKGQRIPIHEDINITKAFAAAKEALNMSGGGLDDGYVPASFQEGSTLSIPIMTKEKAFGILYLKTKEDSDLVNDAHMLLSEMASQTAVAIENMKLTKSIIESEEKYRSVVDNVGLGIALISPTMEILSLNNQMKRWFPEVNLSKKPICYQSFYRPPKEKMCESCPVNETLIDGQVNEAIVDVPIGNEIKNYRIVATPIKDNNGQIIAAIEMVEDISKQKKMEKALIESERRFRKIFENSVDGILLADLESQKCYSANDKICQMLGYGHEEIRNLSVSDIHPKEDMNYVAEQFTKQARGEINLAKDIPVKRKDGSLFYADINSVPIVLSGIGYLLATFRDVTERKRIEDLIKKGKEEWERTFDSVPDLIALIDSEYRITRLNKTMADRLGMSYQEILGSHCYKLIHGTQEPPSYCPHKRLIHDGKEHHEEIHSERLRGDYLVTTSPLYSDKGQLSGSVHVAHNITERRNADKALRESEEKYREVVESSLIGIFLIQNGVYKFVNSRFCDITGYNYDEIIGKLGPMDLTHPDDKIFAQKNLEDLINGIVDTTELELKSIRKSGEKFTVRILARNVNYLGKPAIMGSVLDLSKEKTLELQLMHSQKMESLGQLAGGIAHDFNNVLGVIAGSLEIIQNNGYDERLKKMIDMAVNAVERGSSIVKRLLLFARAEETALIPISFPLIIDEAIKILEHTIEKNIIIRKIIDNPSAIVLGNKEQLLQMILNICVNARDAMQYGGTLTIHLAKTDDNYLKEHFPEVQEKNYFALRISDTGIGMNDETKHHIFDPFFTTKEKEKGTGLGLSIVHGIVKRHNGLIDIESSLGQGTTFSIFLPLAPTAVKSLRLAQESEIKGGKEKILIVDDEDSFREVLKELLIPLGYEVMEAKDGLEAVEKFKENSPTFDLIILDIGLPKMAGDEAFLKIKEINPEMNIILASGYLEHEKKSELFKLGLREFLQKPYSLKEVAITVRRILDDHKRKTEEMPQLA